MGYMDIYAMSICKPRNANLHAAQMVKLCCWGPTGRCFCQDLRSGFFVTIGLLRVSEQG